MHIYSQRCNASIPSKSFTEPFSSPGPLTTSSGCQTKESLPPHQRGSLKVDRRIREYGTQTEGPVETKVAMGTSSRPCILDTSSPGSNGQGPSQSPGQPPRPTQSNRSVPPQNPMPVAVSAPSQGPGPPPPKPTQSKHSIPPQNLTPASAYHGPGPVPNPTLSHHSIASQNPALSASGILQAHHSSTSGAVSESTHVSSSAKPGQATKMSSKLLNQDTDRRPTQPLETKGVETPAKKTESKPDITEILFGGQQPQSSQGVKPKASNQLGVGKSQSSQSQLDPEKKKQLLAKLMEMDGTQNAPSKVASGVVASLNPALADKSSSKHELVEQKVGQGPLPGNRTSPLSQEEKIENMHKGRPTFSTEDDPYGSKHMNRAGSQTSISASPQAQRPRHRRRTEQAAADEGASNALADEPIGYQPSFGRRAAVSRSQITNSTLAGMENKPQSQQLNSKETNPPEKSRQQQNIFASDTPLQNSGQPQAYPWEKKINVSRTGVVTTLGESDDIEELAL